MDAPAEPGTGPMLVPDDQFTDRSETPAGSRTRSVGAMPAPRWFWRFMYDRESAAWERRRDEPEHRELVERTADELANVVAPPGPVADLGCGPGAHALALARRGYDVVGVDGSPRMVEVARTRAARDKVDAAFDVHDVGAPLRFADASRGGVLAILVLQHLPHPAAFIAEIRRCLRPGGHLLIVTVDQSTQIDRAITGDYQAMAWRNHPGGDPDIQYVWWQSTYPTNFGRIEDPAIDDLLTRGRTPQTRTGASRSTRTSTSASASRSTTCGWPTRCGLWRRHPWCTASTPPPAWPSGTRWKPSGSSTSCCRPRGW
jgi:SAM-dependent methyltransferase